MRREDDEAETIRRRSENYDKTEATVVEHYRNLGRLMRIGGKTSDEIYAKLKPSLIKAMQEKAKL